MTFNDLIAVKGFTVYALSKESGIAKTTIFDISSSKTDLLTCTGKTLKAIATTLKISIEELLELDKEDLSLYPSYISSTINKIRDALRDRSPIIEIYLNQLYSCVDNALKQGLLTSEQSALLIDRYKNLVEGSKDEKK